MKTLFLNTFIFFFITAAIVSHAEWKANLDYCNRSSWNWYFGNNAALRFDENTIRTDSAGQINTSEGCASASDSAGNLLFYTDGITVWNSDHKVVKNGRDLNGHHSTTHSAVIVPWPLRKRIYYIFTLDKEADARGLCYSIMDTKARDGNGEITQKNVNIVAPVGEKLAVARHCNGRDYWIVAHEWNSNSFLSYRLTPNGLVTTPVISSSGAVHAGGTSNIFGYMRFSQDQKQLAVAIFGKSLIEIFDFNNSTGKVYGPLSLHYEGHYSYKPYGLEFSPSGRYLFVNSLSGFETLLVFDLKSKNPEKIIKELGFISDRTSGALQMGPDGCIYVSRNQEPYLARIVNPDKGPQCYFDLSAINLHPGKCTFGLPYFTAPDFEDIHVYTIGEPCPGNDIQFVVDNNCDYSGNYKWEGPEGFSSTLPMPVIENVSHRHAGTYSLTFTANGKSKYKSVCLNIDRFQHVSIIPETEDPLCMGDSLVLAAGPENPDIIYQWSTGATYPEITVYESGTYSLLASTPNGCTSSDTIEVEFMPAPDASIIVEDTAFCKGDYIIAQAGNYSDENIYEWSNGTTGQSATFEYAGVHTLEVTSPDGCESSATFRSLMHKQPEPVINADRLCLCPGESVALEVDNNYPVIQWSTGETSRRISIDSPGNYEVWTENEFGCGASASISIERKVTEIRLSGNAIIFDWTETGGSISKTISLKNTSVYTATIENMYFKHGGQCYSLSPPVSMPKDINSGDSLIIPVRFSPDESETYSDSLIIDISHPCPTRHSVLISGKGKSPALVFADNATGYPGEKVDIPIKSRLGWDTQEEIATKFSATVSLNKNAIWPEQSDSYIESGRQKFRIAGETILTEDNLTIATIQVMILLCDSLKNEIRIDDLSFETDRLTPVLKSGILTQKEVCAHNLRVVSPDIRLIPMPADDYIKIIFSKPVNEDIRIAIVSLAGKIIRSGTFDGGGKISLRMNCADMPAGSYFVRINYGARIIHRRLIIMH